MRNKSSWTRGILEAARAVKIDEEIKGEEQLMAKRFKN